MGFECQCNGQKYLIELVRDVTPLWDQRDKNYHNRDLKRKLWDEIGEKLNVTGRYWNNNTNEIGYYLLTYIRYLWYWYILYQNGNCCCEYLLIIYVIHNKCSIMWCYIEHSAQIILLALWWYRCSGAVKVSFESISYIYCSFWGTTEWSTADICSGLTGSTNLWSFLKNRMIICCSFKIYGDVMQ